MIRAEERAVVVSSQISLEQRAALERMAQEGYRSLSAQVRRAICEHLEREGAESTSSPAAAVRPAAAGEVFSGTGATREAS